MAVAVTIEDDKGMEKRSTCYRRTWCELDLVNREVEARRLHLPACHVVDEVSFASFEKLLTRACSLQLLEFESQEELVLL